MLAFRRWLAEMMHIAGRELGLLFRDSGVLIFCLAVPLGYPLLYAYIYTTELMREVPVTVVDDCKTALSREFVRKLDATQWVKVIAVSEDVPAALQQIKEQQSYGYFVIPTDFSQRIVTGQQAFIGMYADMSGMLYYKGMLVGATDVSLDMNEHIKIARSGLSTVREEQLVSYPVRNQEVSLFNPQQGFAVFLIPAVLILIIQQTLLLGIGMAGGTAAERGSYRQWLLRERPRPGLFCLLMGRSAAYLLLYAIISAYILCLVPRFFGLVQIVRGLDLLLFMIPYLLSCIFLAFTLTILMRNREMSILVFVFTSLPLLFISGISWPGSALPGFWKGVSYLFPSTFGINGFVRMNNMGASLHQVATEYMALWLQTIVYSFTAWLSFRRLRKYEMRTE